MNSPPLLIVTTRLPPHVCGIGTYSWFLHRHWPVQDSNVQFLVVEGAVESAKKLGFTAITEFGADAAKLSAAVDRFGTADLLLHYAGRAYQRFGCPLWLPSVLRKWKAKFSAARLAIFFHELPGDNFRFTSRFFWIDKCNRRVVRQLVEIADAMATNTHEHVRTINQISGRGDAQFVPVGSNIQPLEDSSVQRIRSEFAIFGLPFGRWQTLQIFQSEIRQWQRDGFLTKLHLVGPRDEKFDRIADQLIETLPEPNVVVRHGMLPSIDVSKLLRRIQFGLTNAINENWSKSTTFMAYAAHGCSIVGKVKSESAPLNLVISPSQVATISEADLRARSTRLLQWYQENADWDPIARQIAGLFPNRVEKAMA
jgi:hypothetical protein